MKDIDNELNLDELEDVTGGLTPNYPSGIKNGAVPKKNAAILNGMQNGLRSGMQGIMQNNDNAAQDPKDLPDNICPKCGSVLRLDPEAKVYYCTLCNYSKSQVL